MRHVDLTEEELHVLMSLVDSRIREMHPEIRRSRVSTFTEELKHDLKDLEQLLDKLEDATGETPAESS